MNSNPVIQQQSLQAFAQNIKCIQSKNLESVSNKKFLEKNGFKNLLCKNYERYKSIKLFGHE